MHAEVTVLVAAAAAAAAACNSFFFATWDLCAEHGKGTSL